MSRSEGTKNPSLTRGYYDTTSDDETKRKTRWSELRGIRINVMYIGTTFITQVWWSLPDSVNDSGGGGVITDIG